MTIVQNAPKLRSLGSQRPTAKMPHTDRDDDAYFLSEGLAYRCRQGQILPQLWIVENAKRKKEPRRLLFSTGSRVFQALDPSIKRYAQTKRLWRVAPSVRLSVFAILPAGFSSEPVTSRFAHLLSSKNVVRRFTYELTPSCENVALTARGSSLSTASLALEQWRCRGRQHRVTAAWLISPLLLVRAAAVGFICVSRKWRKPRECPGFDIPSHP